MVKSSKVGMFMAAPASFLLFSFVILPFLLAIIFSFTNLQLTGKSFNWIGVDNYSNLLGIKTVTLHGEIQEDGQVKMPSMRSVIRSDADWKRAKTLFKVPFVSNDTKHVYVVARDIVFWWAIFNTCIFVLLVVPLQCGSALLLALLVNRSFRGRNFFRTAFFIPVVTSMVVVSIVWKYIFKYDGGLNQLLGLNIDWLNNPYTAMAAIVIMSAWQGAGYQMIIFLAGLQSIPADQYEAAAIDGANPWQQFLNITLPGLRNTTLFVVVSTTMMAFALFTQIDILTKGGPNNTTQTLIFHAVRMGTEQHKIGYASAISVVYFIIILIIAFIQKNLMDKKEG